MKEKILNLEKDLFKYEKISNIDWLNNIIDDNFVECGKSGNIYDKKITVKELSNCKSDRNITIYNYSYEKIDNNTHMVHYITKSDNVLYYRTSIWIDNNGLKLLFHQASKLTDDSIKELHEY